MYCMSVLKLERCQLDGEVPPLSAFIILCPHCEWKHCDDLLGNWRQQQEGKTLNIFRDKSILFGPESTCRDVPRTCWGHGGVNRTILWILCPWLLKRDDIAEVPNSAAKWEQAENDPTLQKWPFSKRLYFKFTLTRTETVIRTLHTQRHTHTHTHSTELDSLLFGTLSEQPKGTGDMCGVMHLWDDTSARRWATTVTLTEDKNPCQSPAATAASISGVTHGVIVDVLTPPPRHVLPMNRRGPVPPGFEQIAWQMRNGETFICGKVVAKRAGKVNGRVTVEKV